MAINYNQSYHRKNDVISHNEILTRKFSDEKILEDLLLNKEPIAFNTIRYKVITLGILWRNNIDIINTLNCSLTLFKYAFHTSLVYTSTHYVYVFECFDNYSKRFHKIRIKTLN